MLKLLSVPILVLLYVLMLRGDARATVLGDAAASMRAGEWRMLPRPANASVISSNGSITPYADSWVWNPITQKGHGEKNIFKYSAAGAWSTLPKGTWNAQGLPSGVYLWRTT